MKRKIMITVIFAVFVSAFMMLTTLSGCTGKKTSSESAASSEVVSSAGRQDGERFEEVIQLEGMEETVRYEHVRNETAGFELDYDYEQLERRGEPSHEQFVSRIDDPEKTENYIEVIFRSEDADTVSKAVKADLSKKYGKVIMEEQYMLDRAGSCVQISASEAKKKKAPVDSLETVYIIPASDGCLVATSHCTIESAEGFGARFTYIIHTISVLDK